MITVKMLCTGDEVLHGQIIDTNGAWLADYFFQQGFPLCQRNIVGDNLPVLVKTLDEMSQHCDILIVNGGLGPTTDDLSAEAASLLLQEPLIENQQWLTHLTRSFQQRGLTLSENNRKQAKLPASATMIHNAIGTACGFSLTFNNCLILFTPGVPEEMKNMIQEEIIPLLKQRWPADHSLACLRLTTFGKTESSLDLLLKSISVPEYCVIGYRSSPPIIEIKLTGPKFTIHDMQTSWDQIKERIGTNCIYEGTEGITVNLQQQLYQRHLSLTVHETFTSGLLQLQLASANVPLHQGEVIPSNKVNALSPLALKTQLADYDSDILLWIGAMHKNEIMLGMKVPNDCFLLSIRYKMHHHTLLQKQQTISLLAQDILRRWLNGYAIIGDYNWLEITLLS